MDESSLPRTRPLQTLLLCVQPRSTAGTIADHVNSFKRYSRNRVEVLQNFTAMYGTYGGRLRTLPSGAALDQYDVVVLHYSNYLLSDQHLDDASREILRNFSGLKVLFLQDEYRQIDAISEQIRDLGFHVLFTCVPKAEIEKVYPASRLPGVSKYQNLTGYVPLELTKHRVRPIADRPIDVGYRTRKVPYWLGSLGAEKWQIAPRFLAEVSGAGLNCDISYREEDRLYGRRWTRFLKSCRTALGTESGASVFDFTGELQTATDLYVARKPDASFEEIHELLLKPYEGQIRLNQISPRCFEAAALRTAMVLFEGEYSGVLEPERHYIPLRKDFSNIDAVVRSVRNARELQRMVDRTFYEVALNERYSYRTFIENFDEIIVHEIRTRELLRSGKSSGKGSAGMQVRTRNLGVLARLRMAYFSLLIRNKLAIARHRIFRGIYWIYAHLVPESTRAKLRPSIRKFLFRDIH